MLPPNSLDTHIIIVRVERLLKCPQHYPALLCPDNPLLANSRPAQVVSSRLGIIIQCHTYRATVVPVILPDDALAGHLP